jgi:hypothetical protein
MIDVTPFMLRSCEKLNVTSDCFAIKPLKAGVSIHILGDLVAKIGTQKIPLISFNSRVWESIKRTLPPEISAISTVSKSQYHFPIDCLSDEVLLQSLVDNLFEISISRNRSLDSFDCCSFYLQCSDNRACVHRSLGHMRDCTYFHNMRKGFIFYGRNRNI